MHVLMSDYPHTIDNGAGERLTFLGISSDDQGEYLEVRNSVSPGSGPPMHVHHLQEEAVTVQRGTMAWQLQGGEEHLAHTGESASFAPGQMHRFWNAGDEDLVCSGWVRPPHNIEYFLTQVYASTRANGGRRPRLFDVAYLLTRYRSEFAMADIPTPVLRLVFPVVSGVGRVLGMGRRFAGAPEPVTRGRPPGSVRGVPTSPPEAPARATPRPR
jgi:quercetin dioxygenase-like cupin family protein